MKFFNDNKIQKILRAGIALTLISVPFVSNSAAMTSTNYQIESNVIGPGVTSAQSSENYKTEYNPVNVTVPAAAAAAAASVSSTGSGGPIPGSITIPEMSYSNAFNVPLEISTKQSGVLTMTADDKKQIVVDVPENVLDSESRIRLVAKIVRVDSLNMTLIPESVSIVGSVFWDINMFDIDNNPITNLSKTISIKLSIPDTLLDANDLRVYFLDEELGEWVLIPDAVFIENFVIFNVNHMSKFAIFKVKEEKEKIPVEISNMKDVLAYEEKKNSNIDTSNILNNKARRETVSTPTTISTSTSKSASVSNNPDSNLEEIEVKRGNVFGHIWLWLSLLIIGVTFSFWRIWLKYKRA